MWGRPGSGSFGKLKAGSSTAVPGPHSRGRATGIETSIRDLRELIQKTVARPIDSTPAEARAGDVRRNYSSIAKATSVMGLEARGSLAEACD
jgi:UDP-glucose 4-epimerase